MSGGKDAADAADVESHSDEDDADLDEVGSELFDAGDIDV